MNECTGDNLSAYSSLSVGKMSLLMVGLIWIFVLLSILSFPQTPTLCFCFSFCTQPSFSVLHSSFTVVRLFPPLFFSVQVCPSSIEKKKNQHCNFICPLFLNVIVCWSSFDDTSGREGNVFSQWVSRYIFSFFLLLNCFIMCSDFAVTSPHSQSFGSNPRLLLIPFPTLPSLPPCCTSSSCSSVLSFALDSRWGLHADRLALGKGQTYARSVPGLSLLQAADRTLTSCHLTSDLLVADVAVTQGRHYWACSVEPGSYLVKVRAIYVNYCCFIYTA